MRERNKQHVNFYIDSVVDTSGNIAISSSKSTTRRSRVFLKMHIHLLTSLARDCYKIQLHLQSSANPVGEAFNLHSHSHAGGARDTIPSESLPVSH